MFGNSVSIDGNTVVVGTSGATIGSNSRQGAVYLFTKLGSSWASMTQTAKLTASDGAAADMFGYSVSIDGNTVVVGAVNATVGGKICQGAAYVFTEPVSGWANVTQTAKLTASDGAKDDGFGYSVSISGNTVAIGAYAATVGANSCQGAAYVFSEPGSGWADTTQTAKLTASDGAGGDAFGISISISGNTVVVGAYGSAYTYRGAAYVFTEPDSGWVDMVQTAKLTASDGADGDCFGNSVSISGNTVVVGADWAKIGDNSYQGAGYAFTAPDSDWATAQGAELSASDGAAYDQLGVSIAISGNTMVVGTYAYADVGGNRGQGAAYVFTESGSVWTQTAKLTASDGAAMDFFGVSVAISGNTVVVGAYANVNGNTYQGAAYVFTQSGFGWTQTAKLTASDGVANDHFGKSVSISGDGDTVVVGATLAAVNGNSGQGAAYVFTQSASGWTQTAKLTASDGAANDIFGMSVSISGNTVAVGADSVNSQQGAAYVFTQSGSTWTQTAELTASDGAAGDLFGVSISISGAALVVGANWATVGANDAQGAAYVFTQSDSGWTQTAKLTASDGKWNQRFGYSVSISGNTVVVGAYAAVVGGNSGQGAAYVFTDFGSGWTQTAKLTASNGAVNDYFGQSVSIDSGMVAVGAPGAAVGANTDQGAAYVFNDVPNQCPSAMVTLPSGTQSGNVTINYTLTDAESDTCSIQVQYSPDRGTNWYTATPGSGGNGITGLSSSPNGTSHTFVWASSSDMVDANSGNVKIRITPSDTGGPGTADTTDAFTVNNHIDRPPVLTTIANQQGLSGHPIGPITLPASDPDTLVKDLTFTATAQSQLYFLDQRYNLNAPAGTTNYYYNRRGGQEKYLYSPTAAKWYYLRSNGDFYLFTGSTTSTSSASLKGTFIANVGTAAYKNPALLCNAQAVTIPATLDLVTGTQPTLTITPSFTFVGTFVVTVMASDGALTSAAQSFQVAVAAPPAPVWNAIADQQGQSGYTIGPLNLPVSDANTPTANLTLVATAQSQLYFLDQRYNLNAPSGTTNYYYNYRGGKEKYLYSPTTAKWYYLRSNGDFYLFTGSTTSTTLKGTFIANVGTAAYQNPALLYNAKSVIIPATLNLVTGAQPTLAITPSVSYVGVFIVTVTASNGSTSSAKSFQVTVAAPPAPVWGAIADQHGQSGYKIGPLSLPISDADTPAANLTLTATAQSQLYVLDQRYNLGAPSGTTNYYYNYRGGKEKYLYSPTTTQWFYLRSNGDFYLFTGNLTSASSASLKGTFIANVGTAAYQNPALLYNARSVTIPATLDFVTGAQPTLAITPAVSYVGTFIVTVMASDGTTTSAKSFQVTVAAPPAPVWGAIADQQGVSGQVIGPINLPVSDADTPAANLTLAATAQSQLYVLDQRYNLSAPSGTTNYYYNYRGGKEKYLYSPTTAKWYYLRSNGDFYLFTGSTTSTSSASLKGTFIANVGTSAYKTPTLLCNAKSVTIPVAFDFVAGAQPTLAITPSASYVGTFIVTVTAGDGTTTSATSFQATVAAPVTLTVASGSATSVVSASASARYAARSALSARLVDVCLSAPAVEPSSGQVDSDILDELAAGITGAKT